MQNRGRVVPQPLGEALTGIIGVAQAGHEAILPDQTTRWAFMAVLGVPWSPLSAIPDMQTDNAVLIVSVL